MVNKKIPGVSFEPAPHDPYVYGAADQAALSLWNQEAATVSSKKNAPLLFAYDSLSSAHELSSKGMPAAGDTITSSKMFFTGPLSFGQFDTIAPAPKISTGIGTTAHHKNSNKSSSSPHKNSDELQSDTQMEYEYFRATKRLQKSQNDQREICTQVAMDNQKALRECQLEKFNVEDERIEAEKKRKTAATINSISGWAIFASIGLAVVGIFTGGVATAVAIVSVVGNVAAGVSKAFKTNFEATISFLSAKLFGIKEKTELNHLNLKNAMKDGQANKTDSSTTKQMSSLLENKNDAAKSIFE